VGRRRRWRAAQLPTVVVLFAFVVTGCNEAGNARTTPTTTSSGEVAPLGVPLADAVVGLAGAPYAPGAGLSVDAVRISDVMALQASLLEYRLAEGAYPDSLTALCPRFAGVDRNGAARMQLPSDPETKLPYQYTMLGGGKDYEIAATLSNGRRFEGFAHRTPS